MDLWCLAFPAQLPLLSSCHAATLPEPALETRQSALQGGKGGGVAKLDQRIMTRRVNWLTSIRDWQQEFVGSLSAREFVDCVTGDLLGQGVFVFTPSGAVMRLPKVRPAATLHKAGSTAVATHFETACDRRSAGLVCCLVRLCGVPFDATAACRSEDGYLSSAMPASTFAGGDGGGLRIPRAHGRGQPDEGRQG